MIRVESGCCCCTLHKHPARSPNSEKGHHQRTCGGGGGRPVSVDIRRGRWIRRLSLSPPCLLCARRDRRSTSPLGQAETTPPKEAPVRLTLFWKKRKKADGKRHLSRDLAEAREPPSRLGRPSRRGPGGDDAPSRGLDPGRVTGLDGDVTRKETCPTSSRPGHASQHQPAHFG